MGDASMPEVIFTLRWPDGALEQCYSPSTAIADHLDAGATYPLAEFLARSRAGLGAASERVRARYGFPCSRAMGQLARIEQAAQSFTTLPDAAVTVIALKP